VIREHILGKCIGIVKFGVFEFSSNDAWHEGIKLWDTNQLPIYIVPRAYALISFLFYVRFFNIDTSRSEMKVCVLE
jgi:hypothetical protein